MDEEAFQCYLQDVEEENAFQALTEAGEHILPWLEAAYWKEPSPERRVAITEIIWEYRNPASLAFLALALADPAESVWQEALNGMVTIGGCEAKNLLQSALAQADPKKHEWIVEAIEQVEDGQYSTFRCE